MKEKQHRSPKVFEKIISNNLCVGCGLCVYSCPDNALKMDWDDSGFLVPKLAQNCNNDGACLKACPFNPNPESEIFSEDEISDIFLSNALNRNNKIGRFNGIYAGYSAEFQSTSSSGGLATYIIEELFNRNIIDCVIAVRDSEQEGKYFEYSVIKNKSDLLLASKTKYYPVTLATALQEIDKTDGRVAIVGVGCFIKAIRMAQYHNPILKNKIVFTIGIICGGIKSRFYTEYLAGKAGLQRSNIVSPEFRIKDTKSTANDYYFGCKNNVDMQNHTLKMLSIGDMWGTGLFKANACDFCDDVTTELADISLGDAWLEPYIKDGKGTNVIVTRSKIAEELILQGINRKELTVENLSLDRFLYSQQGSFNHRHNGLATRIRISKAKNFVTPPKRKRESETVSFAFKLVQWQRMRVRKRSIEIWKSNSDSESFDKTINAQLILLKRMTWFYHFIDRNKRITASKIISNVFSRK